MNVGAFGTFLDRLLPSPAGATSTSEVHVAMPSSFDAVQL